MDVFTHRHTGTLGARVAPEKAKEATILGRMVAIAPGNLPAKYRSLLGFFWRATSEAAFPV